MTRGDGHQLRDEELKDEMECRLELKRKWSRPREEIIQRIEDRKRKDKEQYDRTVEQWEKMKAKEGLDNG